MILKKRELLELNASNASNFCFFIIPSKSSQIFSVLLLYCDLPASTGKSNAFKSIKAYSSPV